MGRKILFSMSVFFFAKMLFAAPIVFERNYSNHAWGYINSGCMIDESQNLYEYQLGVHGPEKPITFVKKVPADEFQTALNHARVVEYSGEILNLTLAAYDAGITTWTMNIDYRGTNVLKQSGDWEGSLQSPEALMLIDLIDSWCKSL